MPSASNDFEHCRTHPDEPLVLRHNAFPSTEKYCVKCDAESREKARKHSLSRGDGTDFAV
jgi:hypothetical protein